MKKKTKAVCPVCQNKTIVERSHIPYIPARGKRAIIGPGSKNMANEKDRVISGYHCGSCGIEFHQLPRGKK